VRGHGLGVLQRAAGFKIGGDARGAESMAADPGALGRVGPSRRKSDAGGKGAALRHRQGNFLGATTRRSLLHIRPYSSQLARSNTRNRIKGLTANDAKFGFRRLNDLAR
jgi:hypothetical protein